MLRVSRRWRIRPQRSAKDASCFLAVLVIESYEHPQPAARNAWIVNTDVSQQPAATPTPQRAPVRFISRSFRTALLPHRYLRRMGSFELCGSPLETFELELELSGPGGYGFSIVTAHWALALFGFGLWVCGFMAMGSPPVRRSPDSWTAG